MGKVLTQEEKDAKALAKAQEKEAQAKEKEQQQRALVIRASSAMTAAQELSAIVEKIVENGGECDDETLAALQGWQGQLEYKAENICLVRLRRQALIEEYKVVESLANARRKAEEKALERIEKYLALCMKEANVKSIKKEGGLFSVSLVEGRIKTVVEDPNALPFDYADIVEVVKPKTDKIKQALEAGESVPGAHLERGEDFLTIRS